MTHFSREGICVFTCTGVEATPLLISEAGIRREQNSFTQIFILLSCLACFHVHVILKCRNKFVVRFRNSFLYEEAELGFLALLKTDAKVPSAPSVVSPVCLSTTEYQNLLPSSCLKNMLPLQMSNQVEQVYQGHI